MAFGSAVASEYNLPNHAEVLLRKAVLGGLVKECVLDDHPLMERPQNLARRTWKIVSRRVMISGRHLVPKCLHFKKLVITALRFRRMPDVILMSSKKAWSFIGKFGVNELICGGQRGPLAFVHRRHTHLLYHTTLGA
jgi:hypothetical protein